MFGGFFILTFLHSYPIVISKNLFHVEKYMFHAMDGFNRVFLIVLTHISLNSRGGRAI